MFFIRVKSTKSIKGIKTLNKQTNKNKNDSYAHRTLNKQTKTEMIAMCITLNKQTKIKITTMRIKCLRRRKLFTLFIQGNFISPEKNKEHKKHKKHKNVKQATLT